MLRFISNNCLVQSIDMSRNTRDSVIPNFMIIALKNIRKWQILFHVITLNLHNAFSTNEINSALYLYTIRNELSQTQTIFL